MSKQTHDHWLEKEGNEIANFDDKKVKKDERTSSFIVGLSIFWVAFSYTI